MKYKTLELRVGITIFLAVLIFSVGLMWFEGFKIGKKTYEIRAMFPEVGGIDPGDVVNVNGVEKGEVKRVELRVRDVVLTMAIDSSVRIPEDSRVVLQTQGIMGERIVTIILGDSESPLEDGAMLRGVYDPGISEALASMVKGVDDLKLLAQDLRKVAQILYQDDKLKNTIENFADVTEELKKMVESNADGLRQGVRSFGNSTQRIDSLLARNEIRIDSLLARLDTTSRNLPLLFDQMAEVTTAIAEIVKRLEGSDSTLGALIQDRELLDRLETAITGLDELVTDIKENPKKYLKVEIF
ncbi:MAG: MCE family protein [Candidatus Krumholzibacteriota bacterium]|nr:MCE family protein [Candidatus Krumholzibacteriota bacterium]